MNERREDRDGGDLPTKLEVSFAAMDPDDKNRLQGLGAGMLGLGFGVPLVGGLFIELGSIYLAFCVLGIAVGFLFVWPRGGLMVFQALVKLASKIIPHPKVKDLVSAVDRRGPRTEEES